MTGQEGIETPLRERLTEADPFDQVAVVRLFMESAPQHFADIKLAGEDEVSRRLESALAAMVQDIEPDNNLYPEYSDELVGLLLPIALPDPALGEGFAKAADRHEQDESMSAIEVLSYAAAVAFVLLVATVEVDIKNGKVVRIVKRSIGDKALVKLLTILEGIVKLGQS